MLSYCYFRFVNSEARIVYTHRIIDKSNRYYSFLASIGHLDNHGFERRLKFFIKHYKIISINEYCDMLNRRKKTAGTLLLTFDDGYRCFYDYVYPLLKKYNIPAAIFLASGFIGNKSDVFWHDKLIYMIAATQEQHFHFPELINKRYALFTISDKRRLSLDLNRCLKEMNDDRKTELLTRLFDVLKVDENKILPFDQMLSWDEVQEMQSSGLVTFGSHTVYHPILTRLSIDQAEKEISVSKGTIEERLNCRVRFFSYPNGLKDDYNDSIKKLTREAGYDLAFATLVDACPGNDFFEIPREALDAEPFFMFALKMSGVFEIVNLMIGRS